MDYWQNFYGPNAGYILELYDRYQENPDAVDMATRAIFEQWPPPIDGHIHSATTAVSHTDKIAPAVNLANAIREYGHLAAQLNPLGAAPPGDPALDMLTYGLSEEDLSQLPATAVGAPVAANVTNALEAIQRLRHVYTATIGYDYDQIRVPEERTWLRQAAESGRFRPPQAPINGAALLERLTQVEVFEQFLHRLFPGKTRFSIEGLDMLIPILDEIIQEADRLDIQHILLGMAHRGRLNVLAHILNKPYAQILTEFKDPRSNFHTRDQLGWTGDVKYHAGEGHVIQEVGEALTVMLAPNPSHLEHVNPVLAGMARAVGSQVDEPGTAVFDASSVLAIIIHGDAAFPGQGIVAETLNMSQLAGYTVGGTIHIIANNQLGYTAEPESSRSTLYASDLAKGFKIPIVHVNADDAEACIEVARLAFAYRQQFQRDFLIDLVGYRRYGHNEGDEPGFTQPLLYDKIAAHPTVRQQWAERLLAQGVISNGRAAALVQAHMDTLQGVLAEVQVQEEIAEPQLEPPPPGAAKRAKTAVSANLLRELNQSLLTIPADFHIHPKIERGVQRRRSVLNDLDGGGIDWATAEDLALASILADGIPIRLTGEDVERGTFSQRHAVWHDIQNGTTFTPLQALPQASAAFDLHNSPLSENAAVGFEYGYNLMKPQQLIIWEAQYGDFINGAQAIIDEFLVSGRAKWAQTPSLVLLLPHGYEGQGPDHSSGRLERFLQLAAETNIRVAYPSTAAQYFHLLRRQAVLLKTDPLPLVVMTPKSLLRHPLAASSLRDLSEGGWQRVIDDSQGEPAQVRRLVLCSGKVYTDLISSTKRAATPAVAIARLEQLYPFIYEDLPPLLARYTHLEEVVWLQEEPQNMGAWEALRPFLTELIADRWPLHYIGRPRRASPAEGSMAWHKATQDALVARAYEIGGSGL